MATLVVLGAVVAAGVAGASAVGYGLNKRKKRKALLSQQGVFGFPLHKIPKQHMDETNSIPIIVEQCCNHLNSIGN